MIILKLFYFFMKNRIIFFYHRKEAQIVMEGQFLVRIIYDDEITYQIVGAAQKCLGKYLHYQDIVYSYN